MLLTVGCVDDCPDETAPWAGCCVDWSLLPCPRHLCVEASGFDERAMAALQLAKDDWTISTTGAVVFEPTGCSDGWTFVMTDSGHPEIQKTGCPRGYADDGVVWVNGDRVCGTRALAALFRHEIGHMLGLGHTDTRFELMWDYYSRWETPICVTTETVEMFAAANGCCK